MWTSGFILPWRMIRPLRCSRSPGRQGASRSCRAISRSCTFMPAPILKVEPISTRTCPERTLLNNSFFRTSVFASWMKAICSLGMPLATSFSRMSSYTVKSASSGVLSFSARCSKARSSGLSKLPAGALATFFAAEPFGVERSQNTSCVSLLSCPSSQMR